MVAAPPVSYVLGFAPQNLKLDGSYHTLKVSLTGKQKFAVQSRKGYYAPRKVRDPVETAKQEIQEAIFSQDEVKDLAVDLQTQFFKPEPAQAKLSVLAHVDLRSLQFRKTEGRNRDDLTLATAIFDENGNFVIGGEKIVELRKARDRGRVRGGAQTRQSDAAVRDQARRPAARRVRSAAGLVERRHGRRR